MIVGKLIKPIPLHSFIGRHGSLRMIPWTHAISQWLKKWPPIWDQTRWFARRLGYRSPVYDFLYRFASDFREVSFIQIGANDGMTVDPIREFVIANRGWRGLFVEPLPTMFTKLVHAYSYLRRSELQFVRSAVSDYYGSLVIHKIRDDRYHKYPGYAIGIASFSKQTIMKNFPGREAEVEGDMEIITVPCVQYHDLLTNHRIGRVDLLVLDIEGHETNVLKQVPLDGPLRPRVILFEIDHLTDEDLGIIQDRFSEHGYLYRCLGLDAVAVSTELKSLLLAFPEYDTDQV